MAFRLAGEAGRRDHAGVAEMLDPTWNTGNLFVDAVICGAIGGGIATLLGQPVIPWAMVAGLVGPVFVLWAGRLVHALPLDLPGKHSGAYEFAAFALCIAIAIAISPFAG